MPKVHSALQNNSDFMYEMEASNLILPVLMRNFLCTSISSLIFFFDFLITLTEAKVAIKKEFPESENKFIFAYNLCFSCLAIIPIA